MPTRPRACKNNCVHLTLQNRGQLATFFKVAANFCIRSDFRRVSCKIINTRDHCSHFGEYRHACICILGQIDFIAAVQEFLQKKPSIPRSEYRHTLKSQIWRGPYPALKGERAMTVSDVALANSTSVVFMTSIRSLRASMLSNGGSFAAPEGLEHAHRRHGHVWRGDTSEKTHSHRMERRGTIILSRRTLTLLSSMTGRLRSSCPKRSILPQIFTPRSKRHAYFTDLS